MEIVYLIKKGEDIYRQIEDDRGGELGEFDIIKQNLQSFHLALRLLSPCSQVALLPLFGIVADYLGLYY